ncbi:MAG: M14 family metallopeptidase [Gemmatimonadaceae bacterium]
MTRLFALAFVAVSAAVQAQSASYLDHSALSRELRRLVDGSSSAKLTSLGTTLGGREIWVVEIANLGGKPLTQRPGVLVVGNLEGDQLVGSSHALETMRYLLANATSPAVKAVLDANVVYLFPRLNPDGAEVSFASIRADRRGNARPYDDDNDGRTDEDGPEDLNGDGLITVMRVKDPEGDYMIDPADPRTLKKADVTKGEAGVYKLYWEGVDSDGDGFLNEDGRGGVDLNRNFQHDYPYFDADAGPHMVSERESRALMEFVLAHRNIAAILTYGQSDNLVTPPDAAGKLAAPAPLSLPGFADASNAKVFESGMLRGPQMAFFGGGGGGGGFGGGGGSRLRGAQPGANNNPLSGRRPDTTVNRADIEYFKAVSEAYKSITGIKALPPLRRARGAFFQYGYFQFGVPSFSTPGWSLPAVAADAKPADAKPADAKPAASGYAAVLRSLEGAGVSAFVPWTSFKHAQLGDVEIGGFRPYVTSSAPAKDLAELGRKHGEFVVKLVSMLPRVRIANAEVKAHGGGLFTVTVDVENTGFFPSALQHGVVSGSVKPILVQIQVPAENIVTGAPKAMRIASLNGSNSRQRISWVIRGRSGAAVEINVLAQKGGTDSATVTLK